MMIPRHYDFLVLSSQERIIYTSLEWRNTPPSQNAFPEKKKKKKKKKKKAKIIIYQLTNV